MEKSIYKFQLMLFDIFKPLKDFKIHTVLNLLNVNTFVSLNKIRKEDLYNRRPMDCFGIVFENA